MGEPNRPVYKKLRERMLRMPEDLKARVFSRDGYKCAKCRTTRSLEIHHIIPLYYGGTNTETNLITLCSLCHRFVPDAPIGLLKYMSDPNKPPIDLAMNVAEQAFVSALTLSRDDYEVARNDPVEFWKARYQTKIQAALTWFYENE